MDLFWIHRYGFFIYEFYTAVKDALLHLGAICTIVDTKEAIMNDLSTTNFAIQTENEWSFPIDTCDLHTVTNFESIDVPSTHRWHVVLYEPTPTKCLVCMVLNTKQSSMMM